MAQDSSETALQEKKKEDKILTEGEVTRLVNFWEDGLKQIAEKISKEAISATKDSCFIPGHLIRYELYAKKAGMVEGIDLVLTILSGEIDKFYEELNNDQEE